MSRVCLCCGKALPENAASSWHASCIRRFFGSNALPEIHLNKVIVDNLALSNIVQGSVVTGVQKKLSWTPERPKGRKTAPYGCDYIIKTSDEEKPYLPEYEFIGMSLASLCGFKTVPHGLLFTQEGEPIYITKRIDRAFQDGKIVKIPMEDFAQLSLTQTEYKYEGSYERCAKTVIDRYSVNAYLDKIEFFRMVFFSYVIGNTDMHLKNFSLYKPSSGYVLAPFYDILPVLMVVNQTEMALTVHGKKAKITPKDFLLFGQTIGIDDSLVRKLIQGIAEKKDAMASFISLSPLPEEKRREFLRLIEDRLAPFPSR